MIKICNMHDRTAESVGLPEIPAQEECVTAAAQRRGMFLFCPLPLRVVAGVYLFSKPPKALARLKFFFSVTDVTPSGTPQRTAPCEATGGAVCGLSDEVGRRPHSAHRGPFLADVPEEGRKCQRRKFPSLLGGSQHRVRLVIGTAAARLPQFLRGEPHTPVVGTKSAHQKII